MPQQSSTPSSPSRRDFVKVAGGTAAGLGLTMAAPETAAALLTTRKKVAVLGGGVGGLTAAHELAERGFEVTVIEPKAFGGKARSIPVPGTGTGGRADLPGEHGFRFFPGFYKNIPDTFARIPIAGNANGVMDHLVNADQTVMTLPDGGQLWITPSLDQQGFYEGMRTVITALGIAAKVPVNEVEYFLRKMLVFVTSSDQRRVGQWEYVSWSEFTKSDQFSKTYQTVFGTGLTKSLVAAKGELASTRTVALMGEAFVYALLAQTNPYIQKQSGYGAADRLLDLPTSEAWINPWVKHLKSLGVRFVSGHRARTLRMRNGRIDGVVLEPTNGHGNATGGATTTITADWYVCAMPVEQMVKLLNPGVLSAAPSLGRLKKLRTDWMNGIQYFLRRTPDVPIHGHVAYLDTPWALTSIDQGLFWRKEIGTSYGNGRVKDILSVDISDWFTPGIVYGKAAADCTKQEIAHEVWEQMKRALNTKQLTVLSDDLLESWFLDPAITWPDGYGSPAANSERLLINTAGSLDDRPNATTKIPNLFLASDYVRSNVDLATMEGANEAGRAATNGILARSGSGKSPVKIADLWQPKELDVVRQTDARLFAAGLPNALDVIPAGLPL